MTQGTARPHGVRRRSTSLAAVAAAGVLALTTACAPEEGSESGSDAGTVDVSVIYSQTGPLAAYGEAYRNGLEAGLDYATDGTGELSLIHI